MSTSDGPPDPGGTPTRVAALWVPDWPVLAAMTAEDVPAHTPAAVHDGRRVVAVSAVARAAGVRRGMRRRHAQECCPELVLLTADPGRDARGFEPVAAAAETVVSGIEIARSGLLLIPSRGAGRYHGSEQALAAELVGQVAMLAGYEAQVGIADGSGAAVLAARAARIVPHGATAAFLAPLGIGELVHVATQDVGDVVGLVDLLGRLGLRTLGDLARLPRSDVLARFGRLGGWAHQVAAGTDDRPTRCAGSSRTSPSSRTLTRRWSVWRPPRSPLDGWPRPCTPGWSPQVRRADGCRSPPAPTTGTSWSGHGAPTPPSAGCRWRG